MWGCRDATTPILGISGPEGAFNCRCVHLAGGYLLPTIYFIWSLKYGKIAANLWAGCRVGMDGAIAGTDR